MTEQPAGDDILQIAARLLTASVHVYERIGYDKRRMSFSENGSVLIGSRHSESSWKMHLIDGRPLLEIYDEHGQLTCRLRRSADGAWTGHLEQAERMPIHLYSPHEHTSALILQQADGEFCSMLRLTHAWHSEYARRHKIDFWSFQGEPQLERDSNWNKIVLIRHALQMHYQLIIWLDADTLIVEQDIDIRQASSEFSCIGMCKHPLPWGEQTWHYNSGVILIHNCPLAKEFFRRVWEAGPVSHPWHDQVRILECAREMPEAVKAVDDKWNSTVWCNPTPKPIIRAWHGCGYPAQRLISMGEELLGCMNRNRSRQMAP